MGPRNKVHFARAIERRRCLDAASITRARNARLRKLRVLPLPSNALSLSSIRRDAIIVTRKGESRRVAKILGRKGSTCVYDRSLHSREYTYSQGKK